MKISTRECKYTKGRPNENASREIEDSSNISHKSGRNVAGIDPIPPTGLTGTFKIIAVWCRNRGKLLLCTTVPELQIFLCSILFTMLTLVICNSQSRLMFYVNRIESFKDVSGSAGWRSTETFHANWLRVKRAISDNQVRFVNAKWAAVNICFQSVCAKNIQSGTGDK